MNVRQLAVPGAFLIVLLVVSLVAQGILLRGHLVNLSPASNPLSGVVSQSLGASQSSGHLPIEGEDYTLRGTQYFDNNSWVITSVESQANSNTAIIVLHKVHGVYQAVLGPGTAFPNTSLATLPRDVGQYLATKGVIYESTN